MALDVRMAVESRKSRGRVLQRRGSAEAGCCRSWVQWDLRLRRVHAPEACTRGIWYGSPDAALVALFT